MSASRSGVGALYRTAERWRRVFAAAKAGADGEAAPEARDAAGRREKERKKGRKKGVRPRRAARPPRLVTKGVGCARAPALPPHAALRRARVPGATAAAAAWPRHAAVALCRRTKEEKPKKTGWEQIRHISGRVTLSEETAQGPRAPTGPSPRRRKCCSGGCSGTYSGLRRRKRADAREQGQAGRKSDAKVGDKNAS